MTDMMQQCWNWMMSVGWLGMLLGAAVVVGLIVLIVMAILRLARR